MEEIDATKDVEANIHTFGMGEKANDNMDLTMEKSHQGFSDAPVSNSDLNGSSGLGGSKLIRKRQLLPSSQNISDHCDTMKLDSNFLSPQPDAAEKDAAKLELVQYLHRNGIDEKAAEVYKISLRPIKSKGRSQSFPDRKQETRFGVFYIAPNGSLLESKSDVMRDIQENRSRKLSGNKFHGRSGIIMNREDAHEQAKESIKMKDLPFHVSGVKLISLGNVDTRSGFHTCVQLYPVGYKCEQSVTGMTLHKGTFKQDVICEIKEVDGFPQFYITSKNTGTVVIGSSEESAWKQFYPGNIDTDSKLSFFNLEIELLLEGLDGSLDCEEYKFHCERGFGKDYHSNKDSLSAKAAFVKKMERERRSNDRQRLRFLSKEEQDRLAELQRRKEEEDKKLAKDQALILKQRKDQEKEEYKKTREKEKAEEAEKRERVKKLEQEKKNCEKAEEKAKKEENKRESKVRQTYKKDILAELKKSRSEVPSFVMQAFEEEEKEHEVYTPLVTDADIELLPSEDSSNIRATTLAELLYDELQPLPSFSLGDNSGCNGSWNDFFAVANYVHLFRSILDIEEVVGVQKLMQCLSTKSSVTSSSLSSVRNSLGLNLGEVKTHKGDEMESTATNRQEDVDNRNHIDALLERIQLNILKLLMPSINAKLDLDYKDIVDNSKRDKKQQQPLITSLPLNQLTWNELCRIAIIQYLFSEMNRSKDDQQHAIRGSKAGNFRFAKNICRNIRYKWYIRNTVNTDAFSHLGISASKVEAEDRISLVKTLQYCYNESVAIPSLHEDELLNERHTKHRPCENNFATVEELTDEVTKISESENYPEIYRRCAKVLLRIIKMSSAQQFLWEIDQDCPYYYSSIVRPIMFSNVANNVINRVYDDAEEDDDSDGMTKNITSDSEYRISREFYLDMKQVVLNCFTYNTELSPIISSAQKLLHAIYRHVDRWILASDRPPVDCCDDKSCLLTREKIIHQKTLNIKCGKCSGAYNLESLENIFLSETPVEDCYQPYTKFFIAPTDELVNQANEEWLCPFCLQEDFIMLRSALSDDKRATVDDVLMSRGSFFIDEWGPSATVPWIFNPVHSQLLKHFQYKESHLLPIVEALQIVSNQHLSCMNADSDVTSWKRRSWSIAERLKVLKTLFVILQSTDAGLKLITKLNEDGEKLMKYCSKASFREAEFVSCVKEICGDAGVLFSRKLLDGFDFGSIDDESHIDYQKQTYIEGRCMLCNISTFTEDDDSDGDGIENQAILCDGCNGEAHLRCLGMQYVPKESWYCSICTIRQSKRERKSDNIQLDNLDHHRDKEMEEELIWKCVERRVKGKDVYKYSDSEGHRQCCYYCGLNDISLCSPFVYGQSRLEHDHWIQLNKIPLANNLFDDCHLPTTVNFFFKGEKIPGPKVDYPYFPFLDSKDGMELQLRYDAAGTPPTIVHQLCGLYMFQTRVNRSKYEFRKRRKEIGKLIENMGGAFLFPLGYDTFGNEYWHFPYSDDLFIARQDGRSDPDRVEFNRLLKPSLPESAASCCVGNPVSVNDGGDQWIRITETDHIRKLLKLLDLQATTDFTNARALQSLKVSIINSILAKRLVNYDLGRVRQKQGKSDDTSFQMEQYPAFNDELQPFAPSVINVPVSLKLNTSKGVDVPPEITIESEAVFDPAVVDDDEKSNGDDMFASYFSLSPRKYYAVTLLNGNGALVKMKNAKGNDKRTVIYQVRRDGYPSYALLEAELADAWDDHVFYFSSLIFKKSGTYTISFIVQNSPNCTPIKPLVFKVVVRAKSFLCGVNAAVTQLRANSFIQAEHRQVYQGRRELMQLAKSVNDEFSAVKASLILVYLALPNGALASDSQISVNKDRNGRDGKAAKGSILFDGLLEPESWNSILEQTWTGAVSNSSSPIELMECLLILEFYLSRSVLGAAHSKLWSTLPNPHFAIRCSTNSAVGMRIFCLDKVLQYAKVLVPSREKRGSSSRLSFISDGPSNSLPSTKQARATPGHQQASRRGVSRPNYAEVDQEDEEEVESEEEEEDDGDEDEEEDDDRPRRSSRRSSARSSARKSYQEPSDDEFSQEDLQPRRSSRAVTKKRYSELSEDEGEIDQGLVLQDGIVGGKPSKRNRTNEEDEEAQFDDDESIKPAKRSTPSSGSKSSVAKANITVRKSFEQIQNEYVSSLPGAVRKFNVDIAEFASKHSDISPGIIDTNMRFLSILRRFKQDERTLLFWNPVDRSVEGYHDIIKEPMDLGTVSYRVLKNEYNGDISLFMKDMHLIWANCKTFNLAGSILYQYAVEFEQLTARLMESWILSKHRPENPDIREEV